MRRHPDSAAVCVDCYYRFHGLDVDDDTPLAREPLSLLINRELSDDTDSESGDGINEFSWSQCHGCGSSLGGARYRLAVWIDDGYTSRGARLLRGTVESRGLVPSWAPEAGWVD